MINLILIIIIYIMYKTGKGEYCSDFPLYKKILISKVLNDCESGDLILFSNIRCDIITRTMGNPYFSHIGIILKELDGVYIIEVVNDDYVYKKESKKSDMIYNPLVDRVKNYSGYVYYSKLINRLSSENEIKLKEIRKRENRFTILNNCGYFIGKVLEETNIARNITSWKFWTIHNKIIDLCDNITYGVPIQLIADELLLNNITENKLVNYC